MLGGRPGCRSQLAVGKALQEGVELQEVVVPAGEGRDFGVFRMTQFGGPRLPVCRAEGFGDGLESGEAAERIRIDSIRRPAKAASWRMATFAGPDRLIVDWARDGLDAGAAGEAGDVDIDRVQKAPVGRLVGAHSGAIVGEQGVQRVQADDGGACVRGFRGEAGECGEVADALITSRSKGIQMRRNAEAALAG